MHGGFSLPALASCPAWPASAAHWAQLCQQQTDQVGGAAQLEDGSLRCYKREDTRKADELHGLTRRVEQCLRVWCTCERVRGTRGWGCPV